MAVCFALGEAYAAATGDSVLIIGLTAALASVVLHEMGISEARGRLGEGCRDRRQKGRRSGIAALALLTGMLLIGYLNISTMQWQEKLADCIGDDTPCRISGRVYDIRDSGDGYQVYVYGDDIEIYDDILASQKPLAGYSGKTRIIFYMDDVSDIEVGKSMVFDAHMRRPSKATNPGAFDARSYYANRGIYMFGREVTVIASDGRGSTVGRWLYAVRTAASAAIDNAFSEVDASVVKAMLLGEKSGIDKDTKRLFQLGGISHILAISGVHIAIIGMTLFKLLRRLFGSYVVSGSIAIVIVILYGVMTGLASSTFRAVIMMIISVVGRMKGRSSDMLTSAGTAAVIQALADPYVIFDAGFQLSFAAVIGMGIYGPCIRGLCSFKSSFVDTLAVNVAVTFATTPLVIYYFYQFPAYSIILNLVIVPFVSFILFASICVALAGLFSAGAAQVIAGPVEIILDFYRLACRVVTGVPGSIVSVGHVTPEMIAAFYICIYIALRLLSYGVQCRKRTEKCENPGFAERRHRLAVCAAVALVIVCLMCEYAKLDRESKVVFMDVGQGDGILIHTEDGTNILIDGGSSDKSQVGEYVITPVLKYYGAARINYAFVTHGDNDHISGIKYLLETENTGIVIDNLVIPRYGSEEELTELIELAGEAGVNVLYMEAGQRLCETGSKSVTSLIKKNSENFNDKLTLSLLHPREKTDINDINELSAVMKVCLGGVDFMFTGDLGAEGESELLSSNQDLSADVLKVGHHGSRYSSSPDFLTSVSPSLAVISAGEDNRYGHPHEETLERLSEVGADVLCTMNTGAVCVRPSAGKFSVEIYR